MLRQFATPPPRDVLLWLPALDLRRGTASASFPPPDATTYRVLLYGHDATGRLGFTEGPLRVPPPRPGGSAR
jgi:hypothetical protein